MSTAGEHQTEVIDYPPIEVVGEGLSMMDVTDLFEQIGGATSVDDLFARLDRLEAGYAGHYPGPVASTLDELGPVVRQVVTDGYVLPADVPAWLYYVDMTGGVTAITPQVVASGELVDLARRWAGAPAPHAPAPAPAPPVPPAKAPPTPAHVAVHAAAITIGDRTVTAPGLTATETQAISKAIAIAYADMLRVQARVVDSYFGTVTPGQLPEALTDLFRASNVLARQVARLSTEVRGKAPAQVSGHLHGAQQAIAGLEKAVAHLREQFGETQPSTLHTHVENNTQAIEHLQTNVHEINTTTVPELAGAVGTLTGVVGALSTVVHKDMAPALAKVETEASAAAKKLALTRDTCLEQLCEDQTNVINPIRRGGATPSLLRGLGSLLGRAFIFSWVASIAGTIATILDAPAMVSAVYQDTSTVEAWAEQAAAVIESDLSWSGGLHVGA